MTPTSVSRYNHAFSPLFIAVWNVTNWKRRMAGDTKAFSPLFIAVWNVTRPKNPNRLAYPRLSVRFSSRYGMLQRCGNGFADSRGFQSAFHRGMECYRNGVMKLVTRMIFQSAFHRGMECYFRRDANTSYNTAFSPLFIAVWNVTTVLQVATSNHHDFQSAFHRGMECYNL